MRRRRASRIEANNRQGETGGGSRASERGKGAPGVSLCARLSRGVQLNELPVLVPLVPRNSRLSLFRFRLSRFPPPPPPPPSSLPLPRAQFRVWSFQNPTTKLSFRMQTFMIEGNSCATFVKTRSRSLKGLFIFSRDFSTFSSENFNDLPPYSLPFNLPWRIIDGFHRASMNRGAPRHRIYARVWDASPIICRALDILLY